MKAVSIQTESERPDQAAPEDVTTQSCNCMLHDRNIIQPEPETRTQMQIAGLRFRVPGNLPQNLSRLINTQFQPSRQLSASVRRLQEEAGNLSP